MFGKVESITDLSATIESELGVCKGTEKHNSVFVLCIKYVLKQVSASAFQSKLKELTGHTCSKFRCDLIQSIYILRNLKAFVIHMSRRPRININNVAFKYQVCQNDVETCKKVNNFITSLSFDDKVFKRVCDLTALDEKLNSIILEVKNYCELFIRKKLLFVLRSCNYEIHDLSGEMLCKAIATFYHTSTECRTKLHTLNFLRTTCKNHGTNMINYFTAKKRSRLNKVGENEFSLTIVSENQLSINSDGEPVNYETLSSGFDNTSDVMLNVSVKKIIDTYEKKPSGNERKIRFIRLLMGYHDTEFSEFLASKGIKYSNDEYIDRIKPSRYTDLVAEYLEFNRLSYKKFINSLRQQLA